MFDKKEYIKLNLKKSTLPKETNGDYNLPAITCTTQNNGIACYVPREKATIFKNCISVAANGDAPAFYQPHDFTILQDAYVLKFKGEELSDLHYLYFVSLLQKILTKFDWNNKSGWEKVKQEKIELPINKDGTIAFEFMENYIKELETKKIRELKAYLQATGLKNYTLSAKEKEALNAFEAAQNEKVSGTSLKWREFKIGELFEISGTRSLDEGKLDFKASGINFVGRVNEFNGIKGKIDLQKFQPNEKDTITATVIGNYKYVKFQQEPYYTSQNINKLKPLFKFNKHIVYYFIAHIQKFVSQYNGQQGGYKLEEIHNHQILLPVLPSLRTSDASVAIQNKGVDCHEFADANAGLTSKSRNDEFLANQNGQIAFEFMETFIKAIEKEAIKSVVLWSEKRLNATK